MSQHDNGHARIKWILHMREVFQNQLNLLNGGPPNPFHGAGSDLVFAETDEARKALTGWIGEIDTSLGMPTLDER